MKGVLQIPTLGYKAKSLKYGMVYTFLHFKKATKQTNMQVQKFHPTQNAKLVYVMCLINIPIVTSCRILVLLSIAIKNISYSVLFSSCILFTTVELIHLSLFQARFFVIVRTSYVMLQLRFVLHRVNTDEMQNFISSLIIYTNGLQERYFGLLIKR